MRRLHCPPRRRPDPFLYDTGFERRRGFGHDNRGIGATPVGRRVQAAWLDVDVIQCGYCQAGQIMSATALLAKTPRPTDADIDSAMAGNVCRCCTYNRIRAAIKNAATPEAVKAGAL